MAEYPMPPYGVLPFADPIAHGFTFNGKYHTFAITPWRDHYRFMRAVRRIERRKHKGA